MIENKKIKVYMGILSTGTREDIHTYLFRDLQERYGDRVEMVFPDQCARYFPHDFARNQFVEGFLESDCDVLWFLDSDVCPPKFIFDFLVNDYDKWQVAGAPYPLWMCAPGTTEPSIVFTTYDGVVKGEDGKDTGIVMTECPRSGQKMVDALATGCMFIKREVFSKLSKPYFEFKFDYETRKVVEGEDLGFCLKLNKIGIRCLIDYSMVCKHYKKMCLLDMNNYAISYANTKVLEYDAQVRGQVTQAIQASMKQAYELGMQDARTGAKNRSFSVKSETSGLILPSNY